jgi:hypothetical protein
MLVFHARESARRWVKNGGATLLVEFEHSPSSSHTCLLTKKVLNE